MTAHSLLIFTIPKAFVGVTAIHQRNAIQSWLRLGEGVRVVLVGDDPGTEAAAAELGVQHAPAVERNEFGTPLISSVFALGMRNADEQRLCYVNADIILMRDFPHTLGRLDKAPFLMCGRRWDLDVTALVPMDGFGWDHELRNRVRAEGRMHAETGLDYFAFSRGVFGSLPPFAIGRTVWDNWLLFDARARLIPVLDATECVTAVHQNHDYSHIPGGIQAAWSGREAMHNRRLAQDMLYPFTIADATWRVRPTGISPNRAPAHIPRLIQGWVATRLRPHPRLRRLVRRLAGAAR